MKTKELLSILVLSCDKYSDLWDTFFKLRDIYWPDSGIQWYLVTETCNFTYNNVSVINAGTDFNWTGRLKFALQKIDTPYVGWYLDDFYISDKVDNSLINELVNKMANENIDHINMSDVFNTLLKMPEHHDYYDKYLFKIPSHKKYGISTASALWRKDYLLKMLGKEDKNAWQFEIDLCKQAVSENGLPGLILCDERMPFKVTKKPVIIQGKYYPKAIKEFKQKGILIDYSSRGLMNWKDVLIYDFNSLVRDTLREYPNISKSLKWVAQRVFKIKFFT